MIINLSEPSLESWLIPDKMKAKLLHGYQTNDFNDIKKFMLPGDCLISDVRKFDDIVHTFTASVMSTVMVLDRVPFSSIELVGDNEHILGYGIAKNYKFGRVKFSDMSYVESTALLRYKHMNSEFSKKLIQHAKKYIEVPYNVRLVVKSAVDRLLHTSWFKGDAHKEVSENLPALFCSSIIAKLYSEIGLQTMSKPIDLYQIWPSDFLMSEHFDVVAYYQKED